MAVGARNNSNDRLAEYSEESHEIYLPDTICMQMVVNTEDYKIQRSYALDLLATAGPGACV